MAGSGWRKQRRGAPLANTYRSWYRTASYSLRLPVSPSPRISVAVFRCDSQGVPGLTLHKDKDGRDEQRLMRALRNSLAWPSPLFYCAQLGTKNWQSPSNLDQECSRWYLISPCVCDQAGATIESFEGMVILPEDAEDQDAGRADCRCSYSTECCQPTWRTGTHIACGICATCLRARSAVSCADQMCGAITQQ
eukprot:3267749-Rhodomonas_salina.3